MSERNGKTWSSVLIGVVVAAGLLTAVLAVVFSDPTGKSGPGFETYDISTQQRIDPRHVGYVEDAAARIAPGFREVRGVAVGPDDRVHVAGDRAVRVFDASGKRLDEVALSGEPRCLAVADDGALYVAMDDYVERHDLAAGTSERLPPFERGTLITSLAVHGGEIFVADAGNHVVLRCDAGGREMLRIGQKDESGGGGFVIPSPHFDLAVARTGLWVVNPGKQEVRGYTLDGQRQTSWGSGGQAVEGFCGCCNPGDIALLPDGGFVTSEKGLVRVKVYDPDGSFRCVVAGPDQFAAAAEGLDLAVDSRGRVLVLDRPAAAVRVFVPKEPSAEEGND